MVMRRFAGVVLSVVTALLVGAVSAQAQSRVALIIGNGAYRHAPELRRTVQDAAEMAQSFERLGFTTIRAFDASYNEFRSAIRRFNDQTRNVEYAVVYFAGYGIDMRGENYLLPTDADLRTELDVMEETISLHSLMLSVGRASGLALVILDASRNNPAVAQMQGSSLARAVNRGLARVEPSQNVVVAYAARDGTVADDSGLYTTALLKYLENPGLDVSLMFRKVRDEVMMGSNRRQQPFVYGSLPSTPIYLKDPSVELAPSVNGKIHEDETVWQSIQESSDPHLFAEFLEKFPLSSHADESRKKLNGLTQRADAPPPRLVPRTASEGNRIEECDRLAASPLDRSLPKQVAGVELRSINVAAAEPACADAMARRPQVARFQFEAGRIAIARGDNAAAQRLFETAASLGNALAMYSLGLIYAQGQMANLDYSEARRWYQKAVEMNSPYAMAALAALYEDGRGGPRDPAKALDLYRKAAAAGDSSSMTRIGYFYENGLAISKDYGQAVRWYRKGAELGDVDAMKHLGEMYGSGSGVVRSLPEARKWFERAKHASDAGPESIRRLPVSSSAERPN
jgi:tetratricopeptide (TPR) repeat protein